MSKNLETVNKIMHDVIRENYDNGLEDTDLNTDSVSTEMLRVLSECTENLDEETHTVEEIKLIIKSRIDQAMIRVSSE